MRYLIAGDDAATVRSPAQRALLQSHLPVWVDALCDCRSPSIRKADFYRAVALFARDFFAVETQGFEMLDL